MHSAIFQVCTDRDVVSVTNPPTNWQMMEQEKKFIYSL